MSNTYLTDSYLNKVGGSSIKNSQDFSKNKWFSYTSTTETMRTWAKIISNIDEVPSYFKDYFYIEDNIFPYTIFIPEDTVIIHARAKRTNPMLASLYKEKIIILEKTKKGINQSFHNFNGINYLKIESILLYAGIKISSSNAVSHLHFNSVKDDFFKQINEKIRRYYIKANPKKDISLNFEEKLSEYYSQGKISFKFMNYGINSLLPEQKIKKFIFQESINVKRYQKIFLKWFNRFTTPLLVLLNGDELIIIEEPVKVKKDKEIEYGVIFTYIPLAKIKDITFEKSEYTKMSIKLLNKEIKNIYFTNEKDLEYLKRICQ
jgi:hypothetical protein